MNIPTSRRQLDNCITANEMWLLPVALAVCHSPSLSVSILNLVWFFFFPHAGAKWAFLAKLICE